MSFFNRLNTEHSHHRSILLLAIDMLVSVLMQPTVPRHRDGVAEDYEAARRRR